MDLRQARTILYPMLTSHPDDAGLLPSAGHPLADRYARQRDALRFVLEQTARLPTAKTKLNRRKSADDESAHASPEILAADPPPRPAPQHRRRDRDE